MSSVVIQYMFKPNPGVDMSALLALTKEAAAMWKSQGAEVSLWAVQVGEIGNMAFAVRFESSAKLGAALDALNSDPAFSAWRAKSVKSGLASWVRSNQAYEIPL
jgi:hypothetical protein